MSRTEVRGRFICSGCQWSPSSNETYTPALRAGVEQAAAHRILAHDVDEVAVADAVDDRLSRSCRRRACDRCTA